MKVSVSLPEEDVELLDEYVRSHGYASRSAVVHRAVALLRAGGLLGGYEDAFHDWGADGDAVAWDRTSSDSGPA